MRKARGARPDPLPRRLSLRTRLTVWVVAIFAVIQLCVGLAYWFYQRASIAEDFRGLLLERAMRVASDTELRLPLVSSEELDAIARRELSFVRDERFAVGLVDATGKSLLFEKARWPETSEDLAMLVASTGTPQYATLLDELGEFDMPAGSEAMVVAVPLESQAGEPVVLIVVTTDTYIRQRLWVVTRTLLLGGLFGLAASAISGWVISGIAVAPLHRLASVAEQFSPDRIRDELIVDTQEVETAEIASELEAARAKLTQAFEAQERFLSNVSHELKTPIATLLLEAQTINRSELPESGRDFVDSAEEEMRKLGRLIESFLMLTRVTDSGRSAGTARCLANEMVMDAVEDSLSIAEQQHVAIDAKLADDEEGITASVKGNADLLRTMLNNLIRNAARFSPEGGRVTVVAQVVDGQFRVAVRDEGPGLPDELLGRVFDRFAQSSSELRRGRGHGLGLAIAKGIAELHGGDIRVANRPEGGAEFEAVLPLTKS